MRAGSPAASLFTILLLLAAARCSAPATTAEPAEPAAEAVRAAAHSAVPIERLTTTARRRGRIPDLASALADPDPAVRRAATYVAALWADDPTDAAILRPLLTDADAAVRAIVAGSLAGLGDAGARTTLASLGDSTDEMPWSDPPMTVGAFARSAITAIDAAGARR
jgi:hypothetical protein